MSLIAPDVPATRLDRLNPVTRIVLALTLTLPLLLTLDVVSGAVALGLSLSAALIVGYRPGFILRRTWPVLLAAPLASVSMALYGRPSGHVYLEWFLIRVTDGSLMLAEAVFLRVLALGVPSILLFSGIDPTDMADGLAQVWRLPARFVLGTLAGFRLIGEMLADWRMLGLARRARGLGDTGALKRFFTMAFALLVLAIRRGSKLATAMESRGFGGPTERTWARPSLVTSRDHAAVAIAVVMAVTAVLSAVVAGTFNFVGTGT